MQKLVVGADIAVVVLIINILILWEESFFRFGPVMLSQSNQPLRDRMLAVMADVNAQVAEREELVEAIAIAIALLTRKNLFILGAPGQAKSYAINQFRARITGARQFERLLSKQTDEEQLFGRVDLSSLIPGSVPRDVLEQDDYCQRQRSFLRDLMKDIRQSKDPDKTAKAAKLVETVSDQLGAYEKALGQVNGGEPQVNTSGKIPEADKQAKRAEQISASITLDELEQMQAEVAAIPVPDAVNELTDDILCQLRKDGIPVSDRKYLNYYPIAQAKAWLSGHAQVESQDLLALKNYLWQKPADRSVVESTLNRMCVNPMQDKVNSVRGMAVDVQAEFEANCADTSKPNAGSKALIKLRGELVRLYGEQRKLVVSAQTDTEKALTDGLLADMEQISRKAHETVGFTYTPLEQLAALQ